MFVRVALLSKYPLILLYLHLLNDLLLQAAGIAWLMGCLVAGYVYSEVREDENKGAKPLVKTTAGEGKKKST
jgi:FtsH-binding integral membrane protein